MPQFGYRRIVHMDPRPGKTYSTTYHQQSPQERLRTQQHIDDFIKIIGNSALQDTELFDALTKPHRNFPKENGKGYYSKIDVMADLHAQMHKKPVHDIPSGMLGRWNRLFRGTDAEIDLIPESQLPDDNQYHQLFD